jgi:hypothetical protein
MTPYVSALGQSLPLLLIFLGPDPVASEIYIRA